RIQAANFTQTSQLDDLSQGLPWWSTVAVGELRLLAEKFVGETATHKAFTDYNQSRSGKLIASEKADADLVRFTERLLSGAIGSSSARVIINSVVNKRKDLPLEDVFSIVDESSQARQFNEDLLNTTIEHIDQGISVIDDNFRLVAWNSRYLELYKYPKNFIRVGRPVEDMIRHNALAGECGPGLPEEHIKKRLAFMRLGETHSFQRHRADGSVLQIQGRPLPNGGFVTSFSDITEYKKAEHELRDINENLEQLVTGRTQELSQVNDKLQRANRSKTRFLAAVNHDVMQPLNAARLFTAALSQTSDEQVKLTQRINSSLDSAEEIIKTLIDISKLDGGSITANITQFRVSDVLNTLYKEFAVIADNKHIELNRIPCSAIVQTDAHLLRRILQNFIGNALRYTKAGGRVSFGCRRINLKSGKPELKICIYDTGVGIPASELNAIFEEFHQLDNQVTEESKGVGLGLSIAKRISQMLNHPISIESTLGKGSLFSLTVPMVMGQLPIPKTIEEKAPSLSLPIAGIKVLCIDNDPDILDAMQALLERWSCRAYCALSLEAALEAMTTQGYQPDVLLVDYNLGRHCDHGLLVLQQLQSTLTFQVPGVLITADASESVMEDANALGFGYLRKPVNPVMLRKLLMKLTQ
ncbi:MAG: NahK/ErcS family hybrid sensor histidine kinase/response regulator, partial [Leucothrix sp.]